MGILLSCCPGVGKSLSEETPIAPIDAALRREQMAQAAEKRRQEEESRGLKSEEAKKKLRGAQRTPNESAPNLDVEGGLKWQVD